MTSTGTAAAAISGGWGRFTSFASSFASKVVTVVQEEQQNIKKILLEDETPAKEEKPEKELLPPWLDFTLEDKVAEADIRAQILNLTKSKRNFTNAPPEDSSFQFDYEAMLPLALVCLKEDPNLSNARFYLVPKFVKEPKFWRNYFFRVNMIKEAHGLIKEKKESSNPQTSFTSQQNNNMNSLSNASVTSPSATNTNQNSSTSENPSNDLLDLETDENTATKNTNSNQDDVDFLTHREDEFISDDLNEDLTLNALKDELGQLGVSDGGKLNNDQKESWEDEVQKEIEEKIASSSSTLEIDEFSWEEEMKRELEETL